MITQVEKQSGSLFGGVLLVSGCCIGAGMLGLPVLSALAGFQPSFILFILSWLFMTITGLLLLEVNLWFHDEVNIVTMASRTLGFAGKTVAWSMFLFLFYSLMVAYGAASGELFADFVQDLIHINVPSWLGSLFMVFVFGTMIFLGTQAVDIFNRVLMVGLVVTYLVLLTLGIPHVKLNYLEHSDWKEAFFIIPVLIISFGFHNLVPSLTTYLNRDIRRLRLTLMIGSAIPLMVYLAWEYLILGLVPLEEFKTTLDKGELATRALRGAVGSFWIVELAQYFAFFAIITSFLGVALSFVDFLVDGLHIKKGRMGRLQMCLLALVPPFVFAVIYPHIFLMALNIAGGYFAIVLFGILPAAMVWAGRYYQKLNKEELVPGGKILLAIVILVSMGVFALQLINDLNLLGVK